MQNNLALADSNKAIKLDPNNAGSYCDRGDVYRQMGENELTIADFEKCLELAQDPSTIQMAQQALEELGV